MSELLAAAKEICDWLDGQRFRACIIEGLQDVADIQGVVHRQRAKLDLGHIRHWLKILVEIKNDPNLGRPFEEALASASGAANRKAPR